MLFTFAKKKLTHLCTHCFPADVHCSSRSKAIPLSRRQGSCMISPECPFLIRLFNTLQLFRKVLDSSHNILSDWDSKLSTHKLWFWASLEKQRALLHQSCSSVLSHWRTALKLSLLSWSFPQRERVFRSMILWVQHAAQLLVRGECFINVYFKTMYEQIHKNWKKKNTLKTKGRSGLPGWMLVVF